MDQMTRGATLHRNFFPHFHNDGAPISDQLSCGDAFTFVLTVNTGCSRNAQSLVLIVWYCGFHGGLHRRCRRGDRSPCDHQLCQQRIPAGELRRGARPYEVMA